ncbi:Hypothetical predicted protein [Pelobates cultripes]|uniref:Uncharacterized protein n=1 Tax=Pelobates cultripes TaxID=61616 RepID=A0AAD1VWU3_PELCU|nr:Hypothetical predicted protein [Pelobates cultripes]
MKGRGLSIELLTNLDNYSHFQLPSPPQTGRGDLCPSMGENPDLIASQGESMQAAGILNESIKMADDLWTVLPRLDKILYFWQRLKSRMHPPASVNHSTKQRIPTTQQQSTAPAENWAPTWRHGNENPLRLRSMKKGAALF